MNSSKIEELAITFLKDIFADNDFLKTYFSEGDKKPLVGSLFSRWGNGVRLVVGRTLSSVSH